MANLIDTIRNLPRPIRAVVYRVSRHFVRKHTAEMAFWKTRWKEENGTFSNASYRDLMLAIAQEGDDSFLKGKVTADFGCGPRGSLVWAENAMLRIGIDVLASRYIDAFAPAMLNHGMIYVTSTEKFIPMADESVDVMFSLNAIDHVVDLGQICAEILRVLKPGGLFVGGFNLNEPTAPCEPQSLTEDLLRQCLLDGLTVESYRLSAPGKSGRYDPLISGNLIPPAEGEEAVLWVRATKP